MVLSVEAIIKKIHHGDRAALSRAITLLESRRTDHRMMADQLIMDIGITPVTIPRLAITGPPGVGKSSFIEALGLHLLDLGLHPAILTIDPSSALTRGSILGDQTRMQRLSKCPEAFIRQSPSSSYLGGIAPMTRETIMLIEHAGYDVVLIETVGVGQSEIAVHHICDMVTFLLQPGSGDDLQGIKKGIMEVADIFVINKNDGDLKSRAKSTYRSVRSVLALHPEKFEHTPRSVLLVSSLEGTGIADFWQNVIHLYQQLTTSGHLQAHRKLQMKKWFEDLISSRWMDLLVQSNTFKERDTRWDNSTMDVRKMYTATGEIIAQLQRENDRPFQ